MNNNNKAMKRIAILLLAVTTMLSVVSCNKSEKTLLLGRWGVERVEYYYVDYYGQPIASTIEGEDFIPGDPDNGIELVFKDSKKGEWRDHDVDSFFIKISTDPVVYDTIVNPDTTVITTFTYSYDKDIPAIFVKTSNQETYMLEIEQLDETTFSYTNEYGPDYVEHAIMKRLSDDSKATSSRGNRPSHPRKPGSFFSHQSLDEKH